MSIDINKLTEALNLLTNVLAEAGHVADCELDVEASVFHHIEHEMMKRAMGPGSSGGMRSIEFRTHTARVKLGVYRGRVEPERRPHIMSGDLMPSNVKTVKKEPFKKKPEPNLDALLFEADMRRL